MNWWANGGQNKRTYFEQIDKVYIYSLLRQFCK